MPAAFVVDGFTEKKILQNLCPGMPIRMTNLNGADVSITAIGKVVSSFIKLFKDRYFPIFVVVDREGRVASSETLEQLLHEELTDVYGVPRDQVIVACPDRMIENWMLGDTVYFREVYEIQLNENFEGQNGKSAIRRLLAEKNVAYHELTVGVGIFCDIDPHVVSSTSESFARLRRRADPYCAWLRRIR
jgi:hypothetical protein